MIKFLHYNKEYDIEITIEEKEHTYYFNKLCISAEFLKQICEGSVPNDRWFRFNWKESDKSYVIESKIGESADKKQQGG